MTLDAATDALDLADAGYACAAYCPASYPGCELLDPLAVECRAGCH